MEAVRILTFCSAVQYERCRRVILPICSRLADRHLDQTFGIMDVSGERPAPDGRALHHCVVAV